MKLFGTPPTRAVRAMWLINELGIDCEIVAVDLHGGEHRKAPFLKLNPAGLVPVLIDGAVTITESAAIQLYLAEKHPEAGFIPASLADRAQMHRWMYFLVTEIEQPLWRMTLHSHIYPVAERVPADIPLALRDGKKMVAVLEAHMHGREFIAGNRLSVADFNAAFTLDWAEEDGMLSDAPRLREYLATMYARPLAPPRISAS